MIAGLAAEGETVVNRVYHLDARLRAPEAKLSACGAQIESFVFLTDRPRERNPPVAFFCTAYKWTPQRGPAAGTQRSKRSVCHV